MNDAFAFLIQSVFELYLFVLIIRLLLAFAHMHYFNPVVQLVTRLTQPIINPLRKFLPNFRNIELSTVALILVLELIKLFLLSMINGSPLFIPVLLYVAVTESLKLLCSILFYAIIIQVILSWLQSTQYRQTAASEVLTAITSPIIRPIQRIIPPVAGFDISPIPALILLQFIMKLLPS